MAREITNADLWSAIRGCRLFSLSIRELDATIQMHARSDLFASAVIREAAAQVKAVKEASKCAWAN